MQIQPNERDKIALWLAQDKSQRFIVQELRRSQSTVSDEIKRNSCCGNHVKL
jgi:IS30 family transposase